VADLLESDARYFECAAEVQDLDGASLARMPGLEHVAAACVVHRVEPAGLPDDAEAWLDGIERRLGEIGCPRPRVYLQRAVPVLERALRRRGYRPRDELAMLAAAPGSARPGGVSLCPIRTEEEWRAKLALHAACPLGPDGHDTAAEEWVEMERRKSETGALEPYLIAAGDAACGTLAVMECGALVRLKNIVMDPSRRRRGIAAQAIRCVLAMAAERGKLAVGCFAIAGEAGERLYRRCGFRRAGRQTEWARIGSTNGGRAMTPRGGRPAG
jgi:GNAT superfamily N-acetyltransferase